MHKSGVDFKRAKNYNHTIEDIEPITDVSKEAICSNYETKKN